MFAEPGSKRGGTSSAETSWWIQPAEVNFSPTSLALVAQDAHPLTPQPILGHAILSNCGAGKSLQPRIFTTAPHRRKPVLTAEVVTVQFSIAAHGKGGAGVAASCASLEPNACRGVSTKVDGSNYQTPVPKIRGLTWPRGLGPCFDT